MFDCKFVWAFSSHELQQGVLGHRLEKDTKLLLRP